MSKNIWYISKYANHLKYGANSRQFSFCKEFVELGHQVTLIAGNSSHLFDTLPQFKGQYLIEYVDGVRIVWINLPRYKKATSIKRFYTWLLFEYKIIRYRKKLNPTTPNVVIASSLSILSVISGSFLKTIHKAKFIFEVRDIWPQTLIDLKGVSKYHPVVIFLRIIEKYGYRNADKIVGTMPGLFHHVEASIGNTNKVNFIPQGVDLDFYQNHQEKISKEVVEKYFSSDKFTITYAGTFGESYALKKVIEAAIKVEEISDKIQFLFLGDGIEKQKLMEMSKGKKNIFFVPRIKKQQVLDFLMHSDLLLHSFRMKKVFEYGISPNKFIDYMYSSRPIIVMFSGYPSLINEAGCGEFIPSENENVLVDCVVKYANKSEEELKVIGAKGKNFLIENLTFQKLALKYQELFI